MIQQHLLKARAGLFAFILVMAVLGFTSEAELTAGTTWVVERVGFIGLAAILMVTDTLVTPFRPDILLVVIEVTPLPYSVTCWATVDYDRCASPPREAGMRILAWILGWIVMLLVVAGLAGALILRYEAACDPGAAPAPGVERMLAIRSPCYGGTDTLRLKEVAKPVPGDDELLIAVHAAGVNPLDWHFMQGQPYIMRLESGIGRPRDPRRGVDFAGTVEVVGRNVRNFQPGDAVFGARNGAFAEYVVAREAHVVAKPPEVSFEAAAAVPIAAITALQAVRDAGGVGPGTRVLINGASGGVGTYAVQIARSLGAEVIGVSSTRNVELVLSLGADRVIDYTREDFTRGVERYDVIIDNVGNHPLQAYRRALEPDGVLVMVTGPKTNRWLGPVARWAWASISDPFVSQRQVTLLSQLKHEDLVVLGDMLAAGTLRPVIDGRFSLAEVPEAIAYLERGRTRGKNVIIVTGQAQRD
jgi:NADPH:quinone reductase-like Zn-dependent oxidoreductase